MAKQSRPKKPTAVLLTGCTAVTWGRGKKHRRESQEPGSLTTQPNLRVPAGERMGRIDVHPSLASPSVFRLAIRF